MRLPSFLLLLLLSCSPKPQGELPGIDMTVSADFTLITATFSRWVAGHPSGSKGIDYYFTTVLLTEKPLVFDSLFIGEQSYPLFVSRKSSTVSTTAIQWIRGDTIILRAEAPANSLASEMTSIRSAKIIYRKEKQVRFYEVPEIKELILPNRQ